MKVTKSQSRITNTNNNANINTVGAALNDFNSINNTRKRYYAIQRYEEKFIMCDHIQYLNEQYKLGCLSIEICRKYMNIPTMYIIMYHHFINPVLIDKLFTIGYLTDYEYNECDYVMNSYENEE